MSTSRRVKTISFRHGLTAQTSVDTLNGLHQKSVAEAKKQAEQAQQDRLTRERMVEAAMELGDFHDDGGEQYSSVGLATGEDSEWSDDDDHDEDPELQNVPRIFSKYFRTMAQEQAVFRRRHDTRTRAQRNQEAHAEWQRQMPSLVAQYLEWKHGRQAPETTLAEGSDHLFHVDIVGVFDRTSLAPIVQKNCELPNVALIRAGALGCSPTQPTMAIKLDCLELYRQLRRRQSSLGIQGMAKTLCALHNQTYAPHLRDQLSIAFDVYLEILRHIRSTLDTHLGRVGSAWKLCGACPCCAFKQPNEPRLVPARLHSMDGNMSAKRLDGVGHADKRQFRSDYFISNDDVEHFKDDVRQRASGRDKPLTCASNWNAANPGQEDQVQVFEQTGIFLLACRHGFVEAIAEMKRSGELAKYALAVTHQVLEVCGSDQCIGHDIGCTSKSTIAASSLGTKASELDLKIVINAFHGFAHNRACQLSNHPLYLKGLGNEDLETCERVFSGSNSTAVLIRHASYFHWKQFLDLHFDQWDRDKYLELSKFLLDNYKQALDIIAKTTQELAQFQDITGYAASDFEAWHDEEKKYLLECADEPESTAVAVEYVDLLEQLQFAEGRYGRATSVTFLTYTPAEYSSYAGLNSRSNMEQCAIAANTEYRSALRQYELRLNAVAHFENVNRIHPRWSPDSPEYQAAATYVKRREFIRAVDELEGLVVQRLFELAKANLVAGTGYKMRKHISKALTRRCAAIRSALDRYNKLAPRQQPARPKLDYTQVIGYASLGDFTLLKHSRADLLSKPWAKSTNREMAMKYFKVVRSREEIERLNVEVHRLRAWVDLDDKAIKFAADELKNDGSVNLAREMEVLYAERHRVNNVHRVRLAKIFALDGYSGSRGAHASGLSEPVMDTQEKLEDQNEDDANEEVFRLYDCLERVS